MKITVIMIFYPPKKLDATNMPMANVQFGTLAYYAHGESALRFMISSVLQVIYMGKAMLYQAMSILKHVRYDTTKCKQRKITLEMAKTNNQSYSKQGG